MDMAVVPGQPVARDRRHHARLRRHRVADHQGRSVAGRAVAKCCCCRAERDVLDLPAEQVKMPAREMYDFAVEALVKRVEQLILVG